MPRASGDEQQATEVLASLGVSGRRLCPASRTSIRRRRIHARCNAGTSTRTPRPILPTRACVSSRSGRARRSGRSEYGSCLVRAPRERILNRLAVPLISMSMKSMTMIPPMSRKRSSRATASAASRLLRYTVSSRFDAPTFLPVLTSMTVSASVRSTMIDPPDGNHTLRSSALWSCSCTWNFSKIGRFSASES